MHQVGSSFHDRSIHGDLNTGGIVRLIMIFHEVRNDTRKIRETDPPNLLKDKPLHARKISSYQSRTSPPTMNRMIKDAIP